MSCNAANTTSPQRRTYLSPTSAGNERHLYGQGKPNAMDADAETMAAQWSTGIVSEDTTGEVQVESRLFYQGTVKGGGTTNELSRLTDAREKGRIGILGSALSYAGSYGRVTSESIGRDLNPLGRGDGGCYVAGGMNLGRISPRLPWNPPVVGTGNSVNNCGARTPGIEPPPEGVPGLGGPSGPGGADQPPFVVPTSEIEFGLLGNSVPDKDSSRGEAGKMDSGAGGRQRRALWGRTVL